MEVIMHMAKAFWLIGSGQIWDLMEKFKKAGRVIGERWDRLSPLATLGTLVTIVPTVLLLSVHIFAVVANALTVTELDRGRVTIGYVDHHGDYVLRLDNGHQYSVGRWNQGVGGLPQVGKEVVLYRTVWGRANVTGYTIADARRSFSLTPAPRPEPGSEGGHNIELYEHTHVGRIEALGEDEFGRTTIKLADSSEHLAAAIVEGKLAVGTEAAVFRCKDLTHSSILVARAVGPKPAERPVVQYVQPQVVQQIVVKQ